MSYFKRFGDFCSGFACFAALMWLFSKYMAFELKDAGLKEKLSGFFNKHSEMDNRLMLILAVMLVLSVLASIAFKRLPYITLFFSVPPLMLAVDMVRAAQIEDYPMLYIILCSLSVVSGVWECVVRDRKDGGHRAAFAGDAVSLLASGVLLFIWRRCKTLQVAGEDVLTLDSFDREIWNNSESMNIRLFVILACVFIALAVISLILTDIYFLDAVFALGPCVAVIYMWSAGIWTVHAELVATAAVVNFAVRLIPAVSGGVSGRISAVKSKEFT